MFTHGYRDESVHGLGYTRAANEQPIIEKGPMGTPDFPARLFKDIRVKYDDILPHIHSAVEILCVDKGEMEISINSVHYLMTTGSVAIINSYEAHMITGSNAHYFVLQIEPDMFEKFGVILSDELKNENDSVMFPELAISSDIRRLFYRIFQNRIEIDREETAADRLRLLAEIMEIVSLCISHCLKNNQNSKNVRYDRKTANRLKEVFQYIEAHYTENISLEDVAASVYVTKNYFCRFFKQSTGMTFNDYLNLYRCNKAEELMKNSEMTITAIAAEVGYANVASFNRVYKRYRGENPAQSRKQYSTQDI